jgi:sugar phosphate isomerase/epimerase
MADPDIRASIRKHEGWNLHWLDLKDSIFGKAVTDLSDEEAHTVRALAEEAGLGVQCLSTVLFDGDIESGPEAFRATHLQPIERVIALAGILRPVRIRLLAARAGSRDRVVGPTRQFLREHLWLVGMYREAVDRIADAGFSVVIENEARGCIWSTPSEIIDFFQELDRPTARLVWDVQNLWQMGTFPTVEVYRRLRPLIAMVHVKGGAVDDPAATGQLGGPLKWRTALADASWPVVEILRAVVADGASPVICLNPSHGERRPGYDYTDVVGRDIEFLRRNIPEIE